MMIAAVVVVATIRGAAPADQAAVTVADAAAPMGAAVAVETGHRILMTSSKTPKMH